MLLIHVLHTSCVLIIYCHCSNGIIKLKVNKGGFIVNLVFFLYYGSILSCPSWVIKWAHTHTNIWGIFKWPYVITRLTVNFMCVLIWWFESSENVWSNMILNVLTETRCYQSTQINPNFIMIWCNFLTTGRNFTGKRPYMVLSISSPTY